MEELVRFDGEDPEQPIRIWDRVQGDFVERSLDDPRLAECGPLELFWTIVDDPRLGPILRLSRDAEGRDLVLTAAESAEAARMQAEAERAHAEAERDALLERVRELEAKAGR